MKSKKLNPEDYYCLHYDQILDDSKRGLFGQIVRLSHKTLESGLGKTKYFENVLELGAGSGKHYRYVKHAFDSYVESDIRPKSKSHLDNSQDSRMVFRVLDAQTLEGIEDSSVDRLIATCVLIHLSNPHLALKEWRRVVKKKEGCITLYLPCEPGLVLRMARYLTTVRSAKKLGLDHLSFHYNEHRYHYLYLKRSIDEVFFRDSITWKRFPFFWGSWNFNLWVICKIRLTDWE